MNNRAAFSEQFQRLYCDPSIFIDFSRLHPVSFHRVLPFQSEARVLDEPRQLAAEAAHWANPAEGTRSAVLDAFGENGLLPSSELADLRPVVDYFDANFFELMGEVYANAGMFICALRWYREYVAELELRRPNRASDSADVYASVGFCLYSLGLYAEAITWSKSCIGPVQTAETVSRALISYEALAQAGAIQRIERAGKRVRYIVNAYDPAAGAQLTRRLKAEMAPFAPFLEVEIDWVGPEALLPEIPAGGYRFQPECDASPRTRHRMNLLFSLYAQADDLASRGFTAEAKRLLHEALQLEPNAEFVEDKLAELVQHYPERPARKAPPR